MAWDGNFGLYFRHKIGGLPSRKIIEASIDAADHEVGMLLACRVKQFVMIGVAGDVNLQPIAKLQDETKMVQVRVIGGKREGCGKP